MVTINGENSREALGNSTIPSTGMTGRNLVHEIARFDGSDRTYFPSWNYAN